MGETMGETMGAIENQKSKTEIYEGIMSGLENLKKTNIKLFNELILGPLISEGRPEDTFKNRDEFKRELKDRLNSFKNRLTEQYPNYENIIYDYCNLFLAIEENPLSFVTEDDLFKALKETNN